MTTELDLWLRMVLAVLATWRVTHLLASEDGPAAIIARLRERLGHGPLGKLMDCFKCLSLWIAAPMALLVAENLLDWLLCWLALSGAACLLQRLGPPPVVIEPIRDSTQGEDDDDMLRQQAGGGDRRL